ncbi:hypothetical protein D3C77_803090 [compost metagenome]
MDVVRCGVLHGAGGLAHRDGDALAIGEVDHQVRAGHWSADSRGVGDHTAFTDGADIGGEFHR